MNNEKKSSSKNFYIILQYEEINNEKVEIENLATENLNNNFFKIKDNLSRCGNMVEEVLNKEEMIEILFSFVNARMYFK